MKVTYADTDVGSFTPQERRRISRTLKRAYLGAKTWLPQLSEHMTVVVELVTEGRSHVLSPHLIHVRVQKSAETKPGWEKQLDRTMYHECNHAARLSLVPRATTLLALAVYEGLAMTFERDYVATTEPWQQQDDATLTSWFGELAAASKNPAEHHQHWFVVHPDGRQWIGYQVGVWIIDRVYKRNPDLNSADLIGAPAEQILAFAGL